MVATLDQAAIRLDLRSTQGDPLGLACLARNGAGWAGSYVVSSPGPEAVFQEIVEAKRQRTGNDLMPVEAVR